MDSSVRVLLALSDKNLSSKIIENFRKSFPACPLLFDVVEDGQRAVNEVRFFRHSVGIIDSQLPGLSGKALATEILRAYSECQIMIAAGINEPTEFGLIRIELPILDWSKIIGEIAQGLPLDFQIQYALIKRNTIFFDQLVKYAEKHRQGELPSEIKVKTQIQKQEQSTQQFANANSPGTLDRSFRQTDVTKMPSLQLQNRFIWAEVTVIGILGGLFYLAYSWGRDDGFLKAGVRLSLAFTLIFSCVGFFVQRIRSAKSK